VSSVLPPAADKPSYVAAMFGRIAPRYDVMNKLITLGQDARWRRRVAESLPRLDSGRVLDIGSGTGRLAEAIRASHARMRVVAADFTLAMLRIAPENLARVAADALRLPFRDAEFDAVVSGFLIRNLADIDQGLAEQLRVLRPGGMLAVLETTPGPAGPLRPFYRLYFRRAVPLLGKVIAGDASAYTYLPESTLAFLRPARLAARLRDMGLVDVRTTPLMLGCVAITVGYKRAIFPKGGARR
jgi:demethylmenaquinone methyltransferase / 2-methoxy-6-polyprenyl-1,4-benzoquinol methylase